MSKIAIFRKHFSNSTPEVIPKEQEIKKTLLRKASEKMFSRPIHFGKSLRKGELVTTGVVVDSLIVVKSGDTVSVDYGGGHPFGKVVFNFVD